MRAAVAPPLVCDLAAHPVTRPVDRLDMAPPTEAELRSGARIRALIRRLPKDGSVVIVHSPGVIGAYRQVIADLRGADVAAATRVLAAPTLRDESAITAGLTVPVFRDPFVDAARDHRRALAQAWRPCS